MAEKGKGSAPDIPLLRLEAFLPYRLNVLAESISVSLSRIYAERFGIAIPEWRVLVTLGQYRTMTARDVGRHSHMHKTKVSRAVSALARKGLLQRLTNEADKRESHLELTARGQRVYETLVPEALGFSDSFLETLSIEDRVTLDRLIDLLIERAKHLDRPPDSGKPA